MGRPRKSPIQNGFVGQSDFSAGMITDVPAHLLPENAACRLTNVLMDQPGKLRRIGGYQNYSSVNAGVNGLLGVYGQVYPVSGTAGIVLAVDGQATPHLWRYTSSAKTDLGALTSFSTDSIPSWTFHTDKTILTEAARGGAAAGATLMAPKKVTWDGATATLASLGGTPPSAGVCEVYKSRLVLGGTVANPNRVFFSPVPSIESTWDTTNSWIDCQFPITGIAALRDMLLIFSANHVERIIGDTPPPGSNMDRAVLADIGCANPAAIAKWKNNVIFGNNGGIWITNGGPPENLIHDRIAASWLGTPDAVAVWQDWLVVAAGGSGVGFLCYLPTRSWTQWSLASQTGTISQMSVLPAEPSSGGSTALGTLLAAGLEDGSANALVVDLTPTFNPSSTYKTDVLGLAPSVEVWTRGFNGALLSRYGLGHLTYDLRDAASDNPTLSIAAKLGLNRSTTGTSTSLAETTLAARGRFSVNAETSMLSCIVTVGTAAPSSLCEIYSVNCEARPLLPEYEGA